MILTNVQPDTSQPPGNTGIPDAELMYNEFICYNTDQVKLKYLLRVQMVDSDDW
jgi:poly [ADP-ribose] polymerase